MITIDLPAVMPTDPSILRGLVGLASREDLLSDTAANRRLAWADIVRIAAIRDDEDWIEAVSAILVASALEGPPRQKPSMFLRWAAVTAFASHQAHADDLDRGASDGCNQHNLAGIAYSRSIATRFDRPVTVGVCTCLVGAKASS